EVQEPEVIGGRMAEQDRGAPVFPGTDVSIRMFLDHLEGNGTLKDFIEQHPEVTHDRAVALLEEAAAATSEISVLRKYETVLSSGQAALRALMTLNGGATIAFLTFIGHLTEKGGVPKESAGAFIDALQYFVCGTAFAVLGYGTIFLTNTSSYAETKYLWKWKPSNGLFFATIAWGLASLVLFGIASYFAVKGFQAVSGK